jgi:hypothetical protein
MLVSELDVITKEDQPDGIDVTDHFDNVEH